MKIGIERIDPDPGNHMRFTSWNAPTSSPRWHGVHTAIWSIGAGLICAYAIKTGLDTLADRDWQDSLGRLLVVALFAAALYLSRRRFLRYQTIKYFCMTSVTTLFLFVMVATRFRLIPLEDYKALVMIYLLVVFFLATRRGELGGG